MCVLLSNKQKILLLMTETGKEIAMTSHSHSENYAFVVFTTRDIHIDAKPKVWKPHITQCFLHRKANSFSVSQSHHFCWWIWWICIDGWRTMTIRVRVVSEWMSEWVNGQVSKLQLKNEHRVKCCITRVMSLIKMTGQANKSITPRKYFIVTKVENYSFFLHSSNQIMS